MFNFMMHLNDLPEEILYSIFALAVNETVTLCKELPTAFSTSSWFWCLNIDGWRLRLGTPQGSDLLHHVQPQRNATKKSIILTCKSWQRIGSQLLFRYLFFEKPRHMRTICSIFDSEPALGQWTRKVHVTQPPGKLVTSELEYGLVPLIRHCSNLEIVIFEVLIPYFDLIVDSLFTHCSKSLRSVHFTLWPDALPTVIRVLDSLPSLTSVHLRFFSILSPWEDLHPEAADNILLHLPNLRQLSLEGSVRDVLKQACGWNLPSLKCVSLNGSDIHSNTPDIISFLTHHGSKLAFLDIHYNHPYDLSRILDLCPLLQTLAFNADWRLPTSRIEEDLDAMGSPLMHQQITHIGLHGLLYAFVIGYSESHPTHIEIRENNDCNFNSLTRYRADFPKLICIRALSPDLLRNWANGPPGKGRERWERWRRICDEAGIRLEDCTGDILGSLPS